MEALSSILDGTAQWSFWMVVAAVLELLIFMVSTSYILCYVFWNMGWPLNDNFYAFIAESESEDVITRNEINRIESELEQLRNQCNSDSLQDKDPKGIVTK